MLSASAPVSGVSLTVPQVCRERPTRHDARGASRYLNRKTSQPVRRQRSPFFTTQPSISFGTTHVSTLADYGRSGAVIVQNLQSGVVMSRIDIVGQTSDEWIFQIDGWECRILKHSNMTSAGLFPRVRDFNQVAVPIHDNGEMWDLYQLEKYQSPRLMGPISKSALDR